jgi:hypothetical protein
MCVQGDAQCGDRLRKDKEKKIMMTKLIMQKTKQTHKQKNKIKTKKYLIPQQQKVLLDKSSRVIPWCSILVLVFGILGFVGKGAVPLV